MANTYGAIPDEIKVIPQWLNWDYDSETKTKVPWVSTMRHHRKFASVVEPSTWGTFEQAVSASEDYSGIGFVFTEYDPYGGIDFDQTNDIDVYNNQKRILDLLPPTYLEISPSGKGLHAIGRFSVPQGKKRSKIEVYSKLRYLCMTGNVFRNAPILNIQPQVDVLFQEMSRINGVIVYQAFNEPQRYDDRAIWDMAAQAENGDKFKALWAGQWELLRYPSQSEADFALYDIIAFYTKNLEQIDRLFLLSALGQRPKANRIDYRNYMLARVFDREPLQINLDNYVEMIKEKIAEIKKTAPSNNGAVSQEALAVGTANNAEPLDENATHVNGYPILTQCLIPWPEGLANDIARFVFSQAAHSIQEASIAAALGLLGGICGRAYNTPTKAGANLYVLMLAKTGRGKEAMASGIMKLVTAVKRSQPSIEQFIGPNEFRSDAALHKALERQPCQVSIQGEFGTRLKQMLGEYASGHMVGLKGKLLDCYTKSGQGNVLGAMVYSEAGKNTKPITEPALTLLAESTPETFFEVVDENSVKHGLLPRFLTIMYDGRREYSNEYAGYVQPSAELVHKLSYLAQYAHTLMNQGQVIVPTIVCADAIRTFDKQCTDRVNEALSPIEADLWSRAHLKALKVATLISIGINPHSPSIDLPQWTWAVNLVKLDVGNVLKRFEEGTVGAMMQNLEGDQINLIRKMSLHWLTSDYKAVEGYANAAAFQEMHKSKIIPMAFFARRFANVAAFKKDKTGSVSRALQLRLQYLVDAGILQKLDTKQVQAKFHMSTVAYYCDDLDKLMK